MAWCFKATLQLPKGRLHFAEKWPLCDPNELVFVLATYLVFVFKIGPHVIEKRSPFQIKPLLIVYNGFQVANSAILGYRFFLYFLEKGLFPKICDHDEVTNYTIASLYWKHMITKTLDLFDTIFFVLGKKREHVTYLHVYHHLFMVIITWSFLKYDPSDHWAFMAMTDCAVHTIMYTYYAIATMGPTYVKYLWWKKYLTAMQLIRFVVVFTHIVIQTHASQCPVPTGTYWVGLLNIMLCLILFGDFYRKRYIMRAPKDTVELTCTRRHD